MFNILKATIISAILIVIFQCKLVLANDNEKIITINQYVNHVALDSARKGLMDGFHENKISAENGYKIIYSNAQGSISNSVQISNYHASLLPKFMVAIATPAAQTNLKAKPQNTILAFLAVSDAKLAGLINKENIIGVQDNPPIEKLFDILPHIFPDVSNIGFIYNAGEVNSVKILNNLREITAKKNIQTTALAVNNVSDIKTAILKMQSQVDFIYLPLDNTVISALDNIVAICDKLNIALIANDPTLVEKGVMLALGADYYSSGKRLANMISNRMNNIIANNHIYIQDEPVLKINFEKAEKLSIKIPDNIREMIQ